MREQVRGEVGALTEAGTRSAGDRGMKGGLNVD